MDTSAFHASFRAQTNKGTYLCIGQAKYVSLDTPNDNYTEELACDDAKLGPGIFPGAWAVPFGTS
jgi:hypothetical protein